MPKIMNTITADAYNFEFSPRVFHNLIQKNRRKYYHRQIKRQ